MRLTDHGSARFSEPGARVFVLVLQADGRREVAEVAGATVQVDAVYTDDVGAGGPWWHDQHQPPRLVARKLTLKGDLLDWQADAPTPKPRGLPRPLPPIEP